MACALYQDDIGDKEKDMTRQPYAIKKYCFLSYQCHNALPNLLIVALISSYTASRRKNQTHPFALPLPVLCQMTTTGSRQLYLHPHATCVRTIA
jgi:hypothetical protein